METYGEIWKRYGKCGNIWNTYGTIRKRLVVKCSGKWEVFFKHVFHIQHQRRVTTVHQCPVAQANRHKFATRVQTANGEWLTHQSSLEGKGGGLTSNLEHFGQRWPSGHVWHSYGKWQWIFMSFPIHSMVIFHSYVELPNKIPLNHH